MSRADIRIEDHGSVTLARPTTPAGSEWVRETAPEDAQWWGVHALVIEPRYVEGFVNAAREAGLVVA